MRIPFWVGFCLLFFLFAVVSFLIEVVLDSLVEFVVVVLPFHLVLPPSMSFSVASFLASSFNTIDK